MLALSLHLSDWGDCLLIVEHIGGYVTEQLVELGPCLPSSARVTHRERGHVVDTIRLATTQCGSYGTARSIVNWLQGVSSSRTEHQVYVEA